MPIISNKKELLYAVQDNGWTLQYASNELKNDKELVLEACRNNIEALFCASNKLINNKSLIINYILINKDTIKLLKYLKNNELYFLIYDLEYNYDTKYIILDKL